jgi:acyl-CoA thioesterase FadM
VNTNQTTRKATPLPDSFRERVAAAEKSHVEFA